MKKNTPIYPVWVCHPCGVKHGNKGCGVATWHDNTCDICGNIAYVTEPRDFGHLKDTWIDAAHQSETPRTDAAAWPETDLVEGRVARQLERELTAVTEQRDRLAEAIRLTLMDNLDLCDGDVCTLKRLKDAIGFELDHTETTP